VVRDEFCSCCLSCLLNSLSFTFFVFAEPDNTPPPHTHTHTHTPLTNRFYKKDIIPKIRVLIFNGDVDCCVPYKGNEWWTESLGLPIEKPWRAWTVDSQVAGYVTSYAQDFSFLTVKGAGHM
jgi:hypothetical protein